MAADELDLLLVPRRTQQFAVLLDLLIYFNARLAHAIRPSAGAGPSYAGRRRPASLTGRCFFGASLSASQMPRSASLS